MSERLRMMMILKDWFGTLNQPNAPATFWLLTALRTACLVHNWFQTTQGCSTEELVTAIKSYYCTISVFRFAWWRFHVFRCVGSPSFVVIFWLGTSGTCTTLRSVPPEIRCFWNRDSFFRRVACLWDRPRSLEKGPMDQYQVPGATPNG